MTFIRLILRLITFFFLLVGTVSCTELVRDVYSDFESFPTVNSILAEGNPLVLHLSYTGGIDSMPLSFVENAKIDLYIDDVFYEQLKYTEKGNYYSQIKVESKKEYSCKVVIPNLDTIVCTQIIPDHCQIIGIEYIYFAGKTEDGTSYSAIKVSFKNEIADRRFYELKVKYLIYNEDKIDWYYAWMPAITDKIILNEGLQIPLFSNEMINDSVYTVTLNINSFGIENIDEMKESPFSFLVELRSVTYDYYRYKKLFSLGESGNSALYSNVINGNGIFAGYSVFVSDTIIPEPYEN